MVGDQESVAIAMHVQAADGVFPARTSDDEVAGTNLNQVPSGDEPVERFFKFGSGCNSGAQFADELLESGAGVGKVGDVLDDGGVGHCRHEPRGVMLRFYDYAAPLSV
jgi:hypothetical protein